MVGVSIPSDQFPQSSQAYKMFLHYIVSYTKIRKQPYPFSYFQIEGCRRYFLESRIMQFYSFFSLLLFLISEVEHKNTCSILGLKPEAGPIALILLNSSVFYPVDRE